MLKCWGVEGGQLAMAKLGYMLADIGFWLLQIQFYLETGWTDWRIGGWWTFLCQLY